jgi:branched-chain amino acid aminotransferase
MTSEVLWSEGATKNLERDRGFLYGEGLFETVLVENGRPFRLAAHLDRLLTSADALQLPLPLPGWQGRVQSALIEGAVSLSAGRGRARITLTAGPVAASGDPAEVAEGPATLFLHLYQRTEHRPDGVTACHAGPWLPGGVSALGVHKSLAWLGSLLCLREARAAGADEGLQVTRAGILVGGARANLFIVRDGQLVTPSREAGCRPGITRQVILDEVGPALGLVCKEEELSFKSAFAGTTEAFLTSSIMGVMPLLVVLPDLLVRSAPGELTIRIKKTYDAMVANESGTE